ncbi:hypothetical protein RJD05_05910 [Ralstonia sp. 11b]|nr:hypothetical protein [Ralstonia sp. 11b]MDR9383900.1 hypothetical protein [Ralstonia sp. 11b]
MTITTAIFIPVLDFLRPYFPYMGYVAGLSVLIFLALLVMKALGRSKEKQLHSSVIICSGVCAAAFSVGAIASASHAPEGGVAAANIQWVAQLQKTLLNVNNTLTDIKNGKSDDPRVELNHIGVGWSQWGFLEAAKTGDLRTIELFLKGGMPVVLEENSHLLAGPGGNSIAYYVVASNYPKAKEQLALFQKYGVDLNDHRLVEQKDLSVDAASHGMDLKKQPPNLYAVAKESGNEDLATYLAEHGVDTTSYLSWKKAAAEKEQVVLDSCIHDALAITLINPNGLKKYKLNKEQATERCRTDIGRAQISELFKSAH